MKFKGMLTLLCAALIITGCATQHPPMTREEWLNTTTRHYENKTKDEVLSAAKKLFILSDGDDYQFTNTEESLSAVRDWSFFASASGQDYWIVKAEDTEKGVKATVGASWTVRGGSPLPRTGNDPSDDIPLFGNPIKGNSLYELFWARMDYLLGKRSDWMTCEESNDRERKGITWGDNHPLCSATVKDQDPTGKKKEPQPEIKSE